MPSSVDGMIWSISGTPWFAEKVRPAGMGWFAVEVGPVGVQG